MTPRAQSKPFDRPAKISSRHVLLNPGAPVRWQRWGVRDDHPLTRAYEKGQLQSGRRDYSPRDRYQAGLIYRSLYEDVHGSNVSSSGFPRVTGAPTEPRISERLCDARQSLKRLHDLLSADGAFIIRRVCGEGAWPSEAVRERHIGFEKFVVPRFCAALDELVDAVVKLKLRRHT